MLIELRRMRVFVGLGLVGFSLTGGGLLTSAGYAQDDLDFADRRVNQSRKNTDGDITALCRPSMSWSPRPKRDAIADIEQGQHTYYVEEAGFRTPVRVVEGPTGKYLRTTADPESANNLDNLPDC